MNKKRYNHGYKIIKKYTLNKIHNRLESDTLPDLELYGKKDFNDSLSRGNILKGLMERDGCECKECKEVPTYYALGIDNGGFLHLDLYSEKDGEHYMYTIDHVHPKSKGGGNNMNNYQLLCKVCNEDKSDIIPGEKNIPNTKKTSNYINKKLKSLHQQTIGVLNKIKNQGDVLCVKNKPNFTVGNTYPILDINVKVNGDFESVYKFYTIDDNGDKKLTTFNYFSAINDRSKRLKGRFSKY